jgi:hypothetical protein
MSHKSPGLRGKPPIQQRLSKLSRINGSVTQEKTFIDRSARVSLGVLNTPHRPRTRLVAL